MSAIFKDKDAFFCFQVAGTREPCRPPERERRPISPLMEKQAFAEEGRVYFGAYRAPMHVVRDHTSPPVHMNIITQLFTPDHDRYEGVRPVYIHLLRLLYFLMAIGVAIDAWRTILTHEGPWDHTRAVAWCMWAAYPTLGILGLLRPLQWLPLVILMIFYKTLWLFVVAYPLWRAGTLVGAPAEAMAHIFIAAPFIALIVPWRYAFRNFILRPKPDQ